MENVLRYTFTLHQTIEVCVPKGEGADERAIEEARSATGQHICWNDIAKMEIEELQGEGAAA